MFNRQYFAHESPSGETVKDLADDFGYDYVVIGENLALGDFAGDDDLVQAWMDSPGHRANILNTQYREIGIAVGKGEFEGRVTWLAVQTFGTPITVCPQTDAALKKKINERIDAMKDLEDEINQLRDEINSTPRHSQEYLSKINEYNSMVSQYNLWLAELNDWIDEYNSGVNAFNECLNSI